MAALFLLVSGTRHTSVEAEWRMQCSISMPAAVISPGQGTHQLKRHPMARHTEGSVKLIVLVLLAALCCSCNAGRILVVYTPRANSHLMNLKRVADEMAAQRGHNVMHVAITQDVGRLQPASGPIVNYDVMMDDAEPPSEFRLTSKISWSALWKDFNGLMTGACDGLMGNATALAQLKAFGADIMLAEAFSPCPALLASKLDLPWVDFWPAAPVEPFMSSLWSGANRQMFQPNPLSYYPQFFMRSTTQRMGILKRVENVLNYWYWILDDWMVHKTVVQALYKRHGFDALAPQERRRLVMHIVPADWAAEWLRPVSPNMKLVGPVLAGPGKPLPAQFEAIMAEAGKEGVLLVSLGTIAELDKQQLIGMAAAFATLPCKVLWRLTPKEIPDASAIAELKLSNNTKIVTWVPQNDVLAHPNVRALLSHAGINSMYEAIYHAKPVLAMPFFGDQPSNADRIVAKGFGLQMDPTQAGTPAFQKALMAVLTDPQYARAAKAMSVKIRARKNTPVQEAADWMEHVMATNGEPYLKTPEDELSFIARNSIDVYAIVAVSCILSALVALAALRALVRRCASAAALLLANAWDALLSKQKIA